MSDQRKQSMQRHLTIFSSYRNNLFCHLQVFPKNFKNNGNQGLCTFHVLVEIQQEQSFQSQGKEIQRKFDILTSNKSESEVMTAFYIFDCKIFTGFETLYFNPPNLSKRDIVNHASNLVTLQCTEIPVIFFIVKLDSQLRENRNVIWKNADSMKALGKLTLTSMF